MSAGGALLQVYKPELGPLDQRVTLSWLDGILEGEINLEDTEYWFTEPPGLPYMAIYVCLLISDCTEWCVHLPSKQAVDDLPCKSRR